MIEVPRIAPSESASVDAAIRSGRPAVLTGMSGIWPGAPATWNEFLARYRDYPIIISELREDVPLIRSLSELYEALVYQIDSLVEHNPGCAYYAMAEPFKAPLDREVVRPDAVSRHCWRTGRPLLYVGSRGSRCHLHVDSDYSHGLHLVAIGAKTVFFAPPESRALLRPEFNLCGEPFHTWDRIRRRRFISEAGGAEIEVREGEAFLIPKNWYHQVEYLEHSVGLSFRFTRTPAQNLLSLLVRQPISELLLLAEALEGEGMDEAALHWSRSALDVLAMERGEKDAYLALVTFLERSYEELVPSGKRYRSSVGDTEGFETLRRLAPPEHPKPVLRSPANEALEFARASLTHEDLKRMAERSIADEVHDPVRARRAFEAVGWTWPEGDPSPGTMRELLAGLRDHTRYL